MKPLGSLFFVACLVFGSWQACTPETPKTEPSQETVSDSGGNTPPDTNTSTDEPPSDGAFTPAKTGRSASSTFQENATKRTFKGFMQPASTQEPLFLMGTGVRVKIIINVYAFGFYIAPTDAQKELMNWKGKDKDTLSKDDAFYDKMLKGNFTKMIRLDMDFDVSAEDMANAFKDSVEPRIKKLLPAGEQAAAQQALETFKGYFDKPAAKDQEILFIWHKDGKLEVIVDGKVKGTIDNKGLALCLFDIYLGSEPINADGKKNFADGMAELYP